MKKYVFQPFKLLYPSRYEIYLPILTRAKRYNTASYSAVWLDLALGSGGAGSPILLGSMGGADTLRSTHARAFTERLPRVRCARRPHSIHHPHYTPYTSPSLHTVHITLTTHPTHHPRYTSPAPSRSSAVYVSHNFMGIIYLFEYDLPNAGLILVLGLTYP